jgi:hypothetical protein
MLGKIAGAMLGKKLAGPGSGTKGALIGIGAAALARRSVPALAAVAALGWGFKKYRDRRAARAVASPPGATSDR